MNHNAAPLAPNQNPDHAALIAQGQLQNALDAARTETQHAGQYTSDLNRETGMQTETMGTGHQGDPNVTVRTGMDYEGHVERESVRASAENNRGAVYHANIVSQDGENSGSLTVIRRVNGENRVKTYNNLRAAQRVGQIVAARVAKEAELSGYREDHNQAA